MGTGPFKQHLFNTVYQCCLKINLCLLCQRSGVVNWSCVCVSVCLTVSWDSHSWSVWHTDPKIGGGIDNISDGFKGWRSKVKVIMSKTVIFRHFDDVMCVSHADPFISGHLTACNVTMWRHNITWHHSRLITLALGTDHNLWLGGGGFGMGVLIFGAKI